MYVLDTDFIVNFFKNENKKIMQKISKKDLYTTVINEFELLKGCYISSRFSRNYDLLKNLLKHVKILNLTSGSVDIAAEIYSDLQKRGKMIQEMDILIASICISNKYILATQNKKHFKSIKGLKVL